MRMVSSPAMVPSTSGQLLAIDRLGDRLGAARRPCAARSARRRRRRARTAEVTACPATACRRRRERLREARSGRRLGLGHARQAELAQVARQCRLGDVHPALEQQPRSSSWLPTTWSATSSRIAAWRCAVLFVIAFRARVGSESIMPSARRGRPLTSSQCIIMHYTVNKIPVGVLGASGYAGRELCALIAQHPGLELAFATANEQRGQTRAHRRRRRHASGARRRRRSTSAELVFCALPHGASLPWVERARGGGRARRRPVERPASGQRRATPSMDARTG